MAWLEGTRWTWCPLQRKHSRHCNALQYVVPCDGCCPHCRWHGRGKRAGAYGSYLMACYDPATEKYSSVTKVGTGFKDADLISLAQSQTVVPTKPEAYVVADAVKPDVWLAPKQASNTCPYIPLSAVVTCLCDRCGRFGRPS